MHMLQSKHENMDYEVSKSWLTTYKWKDAK